MLIPNLFYPLSGLFDAFMAAGLGLFVYTRNRSDRRYRTYGLFCLSLFLWGVAYFFWLTAADSGSALFWARGLMVGAVFLPVTSYHHVVQLLEVSSKTRERAITLGYLFSVMLMLFAPTRFMVESVSKKLMFDYWPNPGIAFHIHLLMFFAFASGSIVELFRGYKNASGRRRLHYRLLFITITVAYIGGSTNYYLWYNIPIPPIGCVAIGIYIAVFAYAILAYRLLDIDVILKQSVIYASLLAMLLVPCFVVVILGQRWAFGEMNSGFSIGTLGLFIVVGFLFPKLRFRTEEALERVLFKKRLDYRDTLLRSSRDMVSIIDIKALSDNLVRTIGKSLGIDKVSLLLNDEVKGRHLLVASSGLDFNHLDEVFLPSASPLIQILQRRCEPIVKEELEWVPVGPETLQTVETMAKLGSEISLPIISKKKLIGILNLGQKEDQAIYSTDDLELLTTLANQAAIAIENARLYENLKQSQDTLRRADRLSSLGLLTAGLAHEIRNPLVAIRTFTQLLPERYDDAEFREGFQGLALKEVDRICGLINDLLSFARPSKPNVVPENINDVVDNIARILETQAKEKNVVITRDFGDNLPKVWIDKEQMKQVFMNLILNAIQAMQDGGSIGISTRAVSRNGAEPSGEFVQIEVRDTGVGIPEENVQHIFDPFFTSKDEGSGLGLAVSHQIVQEHGGFVTVESTLGKGTAFFVHVPVSKPLRPAANGRAQVNEANLSH
jgi:two-component system nitrogen regulation sensor histidine kinase GlnL